MNGPPAPRCLTPFEGGQRLCETCRRPDGSGLKHCARMIAESPRMRALLARAGPMAASDAPIIVQGETGTGKEVLARAIHASSPREAMPFIAVNCGAIPSDLMESELFGHVRGAFTGAVSDKPGLFEAAHLGTLFLDEIGELPLPLQVKLLRVLQDGELRRVGATRATTVDVRILAATHVELRQRVAAGSFREDLYYRLKVFGITLPPLRERREDILPIARQLLALHEGGPPRFTPEAERALVEYPWPGNIRELVNAVRHGAALAAGRPEVARDDLPDELIASPPPDGAGAAKRLLRSLAEVEREHILGVVGACGGHQAEAARILGIARNTLWRKLESFRRGGDASG